MPEHEWRNDCPIVSNIISVKQNLSCLLVHQITFRPLLSEVKHHCITFLARPLFVELEGGKLISRSSGNYLICKLRVV